MGEYITTEVKGLDEIQKSFEALNDKLQKRGIRNALRAGATVFKNLMYNNAPKLTGFLREHFSIKFKMVKELFAGTAYIGPQGKIDYPAFASGAYKIKRKKSGKAYKVGRIAVASVARYLEFGTGKMGKKPFMTQAYEQGKQEALDAVQRSLKDDLGLS